MFLNPYLGMGLNRIETILERVVSIPCCAPNMVLSEMYHTHSRHMGAVWYLFVTGFINIKYQVFPINFDCS